VVLSNEEGPTVMSIIREENQIRAIIRSVKGNEYILIPEEAVKKISKPKKLIKKIAPLLTFQKLYEVKEREIVTDLIQFEKRHVVKQFKFGVLLRKRGQQTEEEIFSNGSRIITEILLEIAVDWYGLFHRFFVVPSADGTTKKQWKSPFHSDLQ
jgi:hypothetical protein